MDGLTNPAISTLPLGLLRYLGIQNGGAYPRALLNAIQPTLDMLDLMVVSTDANATVNVQVNAVNFVAATGFVVAQQKCTRVSLFSVRFQTGAGENITAALALQTANGVVHVLTERQVLGASVSGLVVAPMNPCLWLQPGDQLGLWVQSCTGPVDADFSLRKSDFFF